MLSDKSMYTAEITLVSFYQQSLNYFVLNYKVLLTHEAESTLHTLLLSLHLPLGVNCDDHYLLYI